MGKAPKITQFPRDRWDLHFYLNATRSLVVSIPPIRPSIEDTSNRPTHAPEPALPSKCHRTPLNTPASRWPTTPGTPRPCEFFVSSTISPSPNPDSEVAQWHLTTVPGELRATSLSRSPSRSVSPVQDTLPFNAGSIGNAMSSPMYPHPIAPHSPLPRKSGKESRGYRVQSFEPYRQPVLKSFRGSQSHIKYVYYWTASDRRLESPPAIPDDVRISVGSVFVVKKKFGRRGLKIIQSWLRIDQAGQAKWVPIEPETPVHFPHGDYVFSIDRSTPSWATESSKKKQEWELKKKVAAVRKQKSND